MSLPKWLFWGTIFFRVSQFLISAPDLRTHCARIEKTLYLLVGERTTSNTSHPSIVPLSTKPHLRCRMSIDSRSVNQETLDGIMGGGNWMKGATHFFVAMLSLRELKEWTITMFNKSLIKCNNPTGTRAARSRAMEQFWRSYQSICVVEKDWPGNNKWADSNTVSEAIAAEAPSGSRLIARYPTYKMGGKAVRERKDASRGSWSLAKHLS
jgi:hypothetical protein